MEYFDLFTNQWKPAASTNRERFDHGAFAHNKRLYVVGGCRTCIEESVEYYDPLIDKWTLVIEYFTQ